MTKEQIYNITQNEEKTENKRWKVKYQKLPNEQVFEMVTVEKTEEKARQLSLMGIVLSNRKNNEVETIKIVSCEEII